MTTSFEFPKVTQSDPSDVAAAIETAQVLWRRGDLHESLRWVRRAAEAAETEGDDMRALSLARAAADLQEQFRVSAPQPAPASAPPPREPARTSAPPERAGPATTRSAPPPAVRASAPAAARVSAPPSARAPAAAARATADLAAELKVPHAPRLEPWVPPEARAGAEPSRTSTKPELAPARAEANPRVLAREASGSEAAVAPTPEPVTPSAPSIPATERRAPPPSDVRTAVRVSVVASTSPGTFVVKLLAEGERPVNAASEALLIPLARDVDLRDLS